MANAYNVSEVHLNPNMAEVEAFRDMYVVLFHTSTFAIRLLL